MILQAGNSFFASGRDNSFASLDFVNGFNGLDGTNVMAVMLQTILSNWIGPVWWSLAGIRVLVARGESIGQRDEVKAIKSRSARETLSIDDTKSSGFTSDGTNLHISGSITENGKTQPNANGLAGMAGETQPLTVPDSSLLEHMTIQTIFAASSSVAVMLSCLWLQNDEALWTVLAPKYVMACLWATFHHSLVNMTFCSLAWAVVARSY